VNKNDKNAYHYKQLKVWQKAMNLVIHVYKVTKYFPKHEQYGLVSQMRRCAISIPSNIAEGHGRNSDKEVVRFLDIARGSIYELDTQVEISRQLNYFSQQEFNIIFNLIDEISRMLSGLRKSKFQKTKGVVN
jgi:four helix bundle protein